MDLFGSREKAHNKKTQGYHHSYVTLVLVKFILLYFKNLNMALNVAHEGALIIIVCYYYFFLTLLVLFMLLCS